MTNDVIVLIHPNWSGDKRFDETKEWVKTFNLYPIVIKYTSVDNSVSTFIQEYWDTGYDIIYVGHDVVPNQAMLNNSYTESKYVGNDLIEGLVTCNEKICTQASYIYPVHTALKEPVVGQRNIERGKFKFINYGEVYCDLFTLELTKFSSRVQKEFNVPDCSWRTIDYVMSSTYGKKVHVHYPLVKHNQCYPLTDALVQR